MTRYITYKCDLCPHSLDSDGTESSYKAAGFALKWYLGNKDTPETLGGCRWEDAPIHICKRCILAIESFAHSAREKGDL